MTYLRGKREIKKKVKWKSELFYARLSLFAPLARKLVNIAENKYKRTENMWSPLRGLFHSPWKHAKKQVSPSLPSGVRGNVFECAKRSWFGM